MPISPVEEKLNQCKAEVHDAIEDLNRRLESVEQIQQLIHKIYDSSQATEQRMNNLMISFSSYAAKQEDLHKAFPDGDIDGHKRAHMAWIRQAEAKAAFWAKLRDEAAKYGIIGVLSFIAMALWVAFKNEVHK